MVTFAVSRMGEVMSAATMIESAAMAKSTVTAGKLVSTVTKSIMIKSVTTIPSVTPTVSTVVWMAPAVSISRAVGVSGISTAVAVTAAWVIYVVATLSRNQTNKERQSS